VVFNMMSNKIGSRIEKLRKEAGLTQAQVAKSLDVRRETVNQWESGTRDLKTNATVKLAELFHVSCDYILRGISAEFTDVNAATGLSNEAIENLDAFKDLGISTLLEGILKSKYLADLAANLSDYLCIRNEIDPEVPPRFILKDLGEHIEDLKKSVRDDQVILSAADAKMYRLQRAVDVIKTILFKEM